MNTLAFPLLLLFALAVLLRAGDAVAVNDLPEAVTAAVEEHLPGAVIASAASDDDDDVVYFDLKVDYRGLLLEVEATPAGRVREIDLNRRFFSLASLAREEMPVAVDSLPAKVTAAVDGFFPESEIVSAARDENEGVRFYELNVKHRDLMLRVDVTEGGELLDIDTRKR